MPDDIRQPETGRQVAMVEDTIGAAAGHKISAFEAGAPVTAIVPRTLGELAMVAAAIIKAGMAPDSYMVKPEKVVTGNLTLLQKEDAAAEQTKARIMIGIMKGAEVGMAPITALSTIAIINNRPCIWGDGAVALIQRAGVVERMEEVFEGDKETASGPVQDDRGENDYAPTLRDFGEGMTAVCRIWRRGQETPYEGRFSVRDARRAHLWGNASKKPWIEHPKRMMKWRARAYAIRDGFADCLMGLSIREEVEDLPAAPPPQADTSFLDDAPASLPASTETPTPGAVTIEYASRGEPAERPAGPSPALELSQALAQSQGVPLRRSSIWTAPSFTIDRPADLAGKVDIDRLRDSLVWFVSDADTVQELDKLEDDNRDNLNVLSAASPPHFMAFREAVEARRAEIAGGQR